MANLIIYSSTVFSTLMLFSLCEAELDILIPPVSRVVSFNGSANFKCATIAMKAFWEINDQDYETEINDERFVIHPSSHNFTTKHWYNISLTMYGLPQNNNTTIKCIASGHQSRNIVRTATLMVLEDSPVQPNPSFSFINATTVRLLWSPPFLWSNYSLVIFNEYNIHLGTMNIGTLPATTTDSIVKFDYTLRGDFIQCSEINITLSAVSDEQGGTEPISLTAGLPIDSQAFSPSVLESAVYFHANGTPVAYITFELPFVCSYQVVEYTVVIRNLINGSQVHQVGQTSLLGSRNITEKISSGLDRGHSYSVQVTAATVTGTSTSRKHVFNTRSSLDENAFNIIMRGDTNLVAATIVLGILSLVLLLSMVVTCACVWRCRRGKSSRPPKDSSSAMITNPIYDGPVYESVRQQYNPLNSSTSTTPDSSPTAPLNDPARYSNDPTIHQVDQVRRNTLSISPRQPVPRVISPLAATSFRSASISGNTTYKHPRRERNKLHLTLSLGNNEISSNPVLDGGKTGTLDKKSPIVPQTIPLEVDENYTVMSPARNRGFGSSLNGGWGEISPELTNKYHE